MKVPITEELREICRSVVAENRSEEDWAAIESDDMFQEGPFAGGFDATERAFCFSYSTEGAEWWFQFTLSEAKSIATGEDVHLEARPAE